MPPRPICCAVLADSAGRASYEAALGLVRQEPEQRFLTRRLGEIGAERKKLPALVEFGTCHSTNERGRTSVRAAFDGDNFRNERAPMAQAIPYLAFNGNCAEAMRHYERVLGLGAKLEMMMSGADSPMAAQIPQGARASDPACSPAL